jgi:hypothetical protein
MSAAPITEKEMRAHLRAQLAEHAAVSGARLYEELQIERGAARVDLALIGQELDGYEIKSDFDDFSRMHNQIHAYNRVFDTITLVTGGAHFDAGLRVIPSWWGVIRIGRQPGGALASELVRPARPHESQDPHSLAMLLWREEAVEALKRESGQVAHKRATRTQLQQQLAAVLSVPALRDLVSQVLLERGKAPKGLSPSVPRDDSLHPAASYWDSHSLL